MSKEIKKQARRIRYTDAELSVIKNSFSEGDDIIRVIRKAFLQIPFDKIDMVTVEKIRTSKELMGVIRKSFLPTIDVDAPLHQVIDLWMTVDIKEKSLEVCEINIMAREKLLEYLEQQLSYLEGGDSDLTIKFSALTKVGSKATMKNTVSNIMMRNTLLAHIEQMLSQFIILAGDKGETVEETKERLMKDSTK